VVIELEDRRGKKLVQEHFYSEKGLLDYIAFLNEGLSPLHKTLHFSSQAEDTPEISVEVAMQYTEDGDTDADLQLRQRHPHARSAARTSPASRRA
jgi:DNA gyrase/topoisomerase IV subunit B